MTIASALDKLNDKLAGSDQPGVQTIEGMILRIIDNIDVGGGGSIPVASADTLGGVKVGSGLSITDSGVLSASGGGGGGGGLIVHVDENYTLDKTWNEITTAAESGIVGLAINRNGFTFIYELVAYGEYSGEYAVNFALVEVTGDGLQLDQKAYVTDSENGYPVYVDK